MADRDLNPETYVPTALRHLPPAPAERLCFTVDLYVSDGYVGALAGPFYGGLEQALEYAPGAQEARSGDIYIVRHDRTGERRVYRWEVPHTRGGSPCWRRINPPPE